MYDADGAWSSGRSAASTVIPNPTFATPYPQVSSNHNKRPKGGAGKWAKTDSAECKKYGCVCAWAGLCVIGATLK